MTTTAADIGDLVHAVGFYSSDREFLEMSVPFCEAGIAAGEPTLVGVFPRQAELLRSALEDPDKLQFASHDEQYPHPPGALEAFRTAWHNYTGGSTPFRIVGEMSPSDGLDRDSWVRYEAAVSHELSDIPARALCLFDTDGLTDAVREELARVHPVIVTAEGGHQPNPLYQPPSTFMANRLQVVADPLEAHPAAVDLTDPSVRTVRRAVSHLAQTMDLASGEADNLVLAVSEVATNALVHGEPPVRVRGWGVPGRVTVQVADAGPGPDDPLAGLRPASSGGEGSGFGLWIAHQLCPEISMATDDGFVVRLATGSVHAGHPAAEV